MPKYLALVKYAPGPLTAVAKEGYTSREKMLAATAESLGGRLEGFWCTEGGDYDFAAVFEVPAEGMYIMSHLATASGVATHGKTIPLRTPAEADEWLKKTPNWTPPGQT